MDFIRRFRMRSAFFLTAVVVSGAAAAAGAQVQGRDGITLPKPPVGKTEAGVDEYKSAPPGVPTRITDPYRWLEDAHSPETRAYITAQNAYTAQYFSQVKMLATGVEE